MKAQANKGLFVRARERIDASRWAPLVPKVLGWLGGFVALALIGSGVPASLASVAPPGDATLASMWTPIALPSSSAPSAAPIAEEPHDDAPAPPSEPAPPSPPPGVTADGKIVLNVASEEELRRLPGIGPTRAKKILDLRTRLGKFRRVEDLLRVKGIGRRALARLKPLVVVDPPPES